MSLENNGTILEETAAPVTAPEEQVVPAEVPAEAEAPAAEPVAQDSAEAPAEVPTEVPAQAPVQETAQPAEPKKKKKAKRKKPHILIRIPLQLISLVLCFALLAAVLVTTVLADLRQVRSEDGIKQIITAFFDRPKAIRPMYGAAGIHMTSAMPDPAAGDDAMIDWLMEQIETQYGEELPVDAEDVKTFLKESTVTDYVAEKFAGYAEDFISGEITTTITTEEITQLIEENKELIEETFDVEITEEITQEITNYVEEVDINTVIQEEVFESLGETTIAPMPEIPVIPGITDSILPDLDSSENGLTVSHVLALINEITSQEAFNSALGICAGIVLLMLLCNFYSIPGGLGWASAPTIFVGILLSVPVWFCLNNPESLNVLLGEQVMAAGAVTGVLSAIAPVHYSVLGIGIGLAVLSIILRIVFAVIRKNKQKAA